MHSISVGVERGSLTAQMLQGSLKEVLYDWPDQELLGRGEPSPLQPRDETLLAKDEVTYIADSVSHDVPPYLFPELMASEAWPP